MAKKQKIKLTTSTAAIIAIVAIVFVIFFTTSGQTAQFISAKGPSQQQVIAGPDLIVSGITWQWAAGQVGKIFAITVTIKNQGGATATGFTTGLSDVTNPNQAGFPTAIGVCVKTLEGGKTTTCNFNYARPPKFPFTVQATVDTTSITKEYNENNNGANLLITFCGDGETQSPNSQGVKEECDDSNNVDTDSCSNSCKRPVCGDGVCGGDYEKYSSPAIAGQADRPACYKDCCAVVASCGDGVCTRVTAEEWCPKEDGTGCASDCLSCGDGFCEGGEILDNKLNLAGSGITPNACTADCSYILGDGKCSAGESGKEGGWVDCSVCGDGICSSNEGKDRATLDKDEFCKLNPDYCNVCAADCK